MSKNYYQTTEGLIFTLYNTSDEDKIIESLEKVDLEELNRKNEHGKNLATISLEMHKDIVFEYLVSRGVDLTAVNKHGCNLLFICTMRGNYEPAKILLTKDSFRETINSILDYAVSPISSNDIRIIKLLIENGARLSECHFNSLSDPQNDATYNYNRDELRAFYNEYVNINQNSELILYENHAVDLMAKEALLEDQVVHS